MTGNSSSENNDIKLSIAKFSVLILSSLLFIIGITIIFKAASFEKKASSSVKNNMPTKEKNISISPYDIKNIYSCGNYLCLVTKNKISADQKILIVNPDDINDIKYINLK